MRVVFALGLALVGCNGGDDEPNETDDTNDGACGEVTTWDVAVAGVVHDAAGDGVEGASVRLEDRGWNVGTTLGTATTGTDGSFSFDAIGVTSVEDCWGTVLDYVLVAEEGDRVGERELNSALFNAIDGGGLEVDITAAPVVIE